MKLVAPTEPGIYYNGMDVWILEDDGSWWLGGIEQVAARGEEIAEAGPFERLTPVEEWPRP